MNIQHDHIDQVSIKNNTDFSKLYRDYYVLLCTIADHYLKDKFQAEEVVGDVFLNYWEKLEDIKITTSIKAYLVRAVQNRCLNLIEHGKVTEKIKQKIEHESQLNGLAESQEYPLGSLYEKELASLIYSSLCTLPDQCRKIFRLSRDEGLTYEEISQQLGISVNTTKTQMKIALSKLRELLKDYLPIILLSFAALR